MDQPRAPAGPRHQPYPYPEDAMYEIVNGKQVVESLEPPEPMDILYETINGQRVELPAIGFYESEIAALLAEFLLDYVRPNRLGRVRIELLFLVDAILGLERRPDVAFISYQRWPKKRKLRRIKAADVVPELAVEVISKTNSAEEVSVKVGEYFRAGVKLIWVIYPMQRQVHVHESPEIIRVIGPDKELDGGTVLPGFRLPVAALFEDELEGAEGETQAKQP